MALKDIVKVASVGLGGGVSFPCRGIVNVEPSAGQTLLNVKGNAGGDLQSLELLYAKAPMGGVQQQEAATRSATRSSGRAKPNGALGASLIIGEGTSSLSTICEGRDLLLRANDASTSVKVVGVA